MRTLNKLIENNYKSNRFELEDNTNILYNNMTYFLFKNYLATNTNKNIDESDIMTVFDNLFINSEIIDRYNIDEYDIEKLAKEHYTTVNKINKKIDYDYLLLLNYYTKDGIYKDCFIYLERIDNIKLWLE